MVERFETLSGEVSEELERAAPLVDQAVAANAGKLAAEEFTRLRDQLAKIKKEHTEYEHDAEQLLELVGRGEITELQSLLDGIYREEEQLDTQLEEALSALEELMRELVEAARSHQESAIMQTAGRHRHRPAGRPARRLADRSRGGPAAAGDVRCRGYDRARRAGRDRGASAARTRSARSPRRWRTSRTRRLRRRGSRRGSTTARPAS